MFIYHLFIKSKILPHHPLHPKPLHRILCGRLPHLQPEPFIREQGENPPCQRLRVPHWHQKSRPAFCNLLGDAADCARHDWNAAGESFEDGGREGVGPGGVDVEVGGLVVEGDLFWVSLVGDESDLGVTDSFGGAALP